MKNVENNKKDFWDKSAEILEKCENTINSMEENKFLEKSLESFFKPFGNLLNKFEEKYIDPNKNNKVLYFLFTIVKSVVLFGIMFGFYKLTLFALSFMSKKIFNSGIILSKSESQSLAVFGNVLQYIVLILLMFCFFYFIIKIVITIFEIVVGIIIGIRESKKEKNNKNE